MAEALLQSPKRSLWNGGESPFKVSWGKLMMWYFLVGDSFSFATFLLTYGTLRFSFTEWPTPSQVFDKIPFIHGSFPLVYVSFMTFDLIMSSVTMVLAVHAGSHKDRKGVMKWLFLTIIGGLIFLGSQAWEWTNLIVHEGMTMSHNPFSNQPAFGQLFFTITGFHGFHVFTGVIINITALILVSRGYFDRKGNYEFIEKIGLYWHFVDLVWVFVFLAFYLV